VPAELSVVALLLAASMVAGFSARYGYSSPLVLTAVGIGLSFVPGVPSFPLTPQLALTGFLPPLLYAAAIRTPFVDMRRNVRPILSLSIGLVLVTTLAVAAVAVRLLPDLAVPAALALGAVVAPPDAVAATAVARRVGMPRRIVTILEGESLFNDATALVTFRTALGALAGSASVLGAGGDFVRAIVVGVAVGLAVAFVMTPVRRRAGDDPVLDTSLSLLVPYVAYLGAEELHGSGVLGVVVAGLVLGHRSPDIQSAASRVTERTLWRTVQFVLENVVFLLIGLQLRSLVEQAQRSSLGAGRILLLCLAVTATVILVRIVWMFPVTYLQHQLPAVKRKESPPPWQNVAVLSWAGMRGVVTLAAGFALVGQGVQHGEVLLLVAFSVVAGTLLVQGSTLPWIVRLLKVEGPDRAQDALQQALVLQRAVDAGRDRLEQDARDDIPDDVVDSLRSWSERIAHSVWERLGTSDGREETPTRAFRRLRVAMLRAERQVVVDVHRSGKVPAEVLEGVMERLDQEEAMLIAFGEGAATGRSELLKPNGAEECEHLRSEPLVAVPGNPDGCQDCVAMGERAWVALRMCLRCGHVGCCDSSPRRHASAHYSDLGHPVMRSIELGEGWRWCFVDNVAA
jgi:CPA1 family monovalent cation:H+ antiporter